MSYLLPTRGLLLLALVGCAVQEPEVCDGDPVLRDDGDLDGYLARDDCDDRAFGVNPSADERCDGLDNDCDGLTDDDDDSVGDASVWLLDSDGDGFGDEADSVTSCEAPAGYVADGGDCDDAQAAINPDADEVCDGMDNDCEGTIDEGASDKATWYADSDGDGFGDPGTETTSCDAPVGSVGNDDDCDDANILVNPDAVEICDEMDNNCDGDTDEGTAADTTTFYADGDADGYGDLADSVESCEQPNGYTSTFTDCDDADADVNPGETEVCDDIDNDCDALVDENAADADTFYADADGDGYGNALVTAEACDQPAGFVDESSDCNDALADVNPGETEVCDGIDNDCDGTIDGPTASDLIPFYVDSDLDGYGDPGAPQPACEQLVGTSKNDDDCDDANTLVNPGAVEICDEMDNDCDGQVDEDSAADTDTFYVDDDGDGYGDLTADSVESCEEPAGYSSDFTDCDDGDGGSNPGEDEICDGLDNNCNALIDDDAVDADTYYADADDDGYGNPAVGVESCEEPEGFVDDDSDCNDALSAVNPGEDESCDALDNDCDASIDEDVGDYDGDGIGDCLDLDCDLAAPADGDVAIDADCLAPDVTIEDPWNVAIEWQYDPIDPLLQNSYSAPLVGHLTDTDLDGDIDTDDVPNVVYLSINGNLVVLDGETGELAWSLPGFNGSGGHALADVDADGVTDIVAFDLLSRPIAISALGVPLWTALVAETNGDGYPQLTVADVDGDGVPEVISSSRMLDGLTGALLTTFAVNVTVNYTTPTVGDLDLDGEQEIILGNTCFSPAGAVLWTSPVVGTYGHWSAIVDVDGDPEGEVIFIGSSKMAVHDADGSILSTASSSAIAQPGPPCVGDFDGDGGVEIAWGSSAVIGMYELNGAQKWTAPINDSSGLAGCSAYDVDGDGAYEILFADQDTLYILDGLTGAALYSQGGHSSGTIFEYPTVADIDQDGSAEILITSNYATGWGTVTAFGHAGDGWLKAGTAWGLHDFSATNIGADGSIPDGSTPPWQVDNVYRGRPAVDTARSDLQVEIADACASSCEALTGIAEVAAQVSNAGAANVTADVEVSLYAESGGVLTLLDTQSLDGLDGGASESVTFTFDAADLGADGLVVMVDDPGDGGAGSVTECDEGNNEDSWAELTCP